MLLKFGVRADKIPGTSVLFSFRSSAPARLDSALIHQVTPTLTPFLQDMKVAFLNARSNAAESHAATFLAIAAKRIGLELIAAKDESELESSGVDFVISATSSVPKVCDYPSYLNVNEPTSRFLGSEFHLRNLMTYDGYLTISDTLKRFVRDVSFGIGRPDEPGFYFATAQKSDIRTDIVRIVKAGDLRISYVGTNWVRHSPRLFGLLDLKGIVRIHGPKYSWPIRLTSHAGALPFDGVSPQETYASCGIGLVLAPADHLDEDVISDRIFQISSVGAVSICPDIPWIRKWFGDSVFYFEPRRSSRETANRIAAIYEHCKQQPDVAARMGERARAIFEQQFTAERMLANAVDYHEVHQRKRVRKRKELAAAFRKRRLAILPAYRGPDIAVVIRCGGRPLASIERAVNSVRSQTIGRFKVVFVKYRPIDLREVVSRGSPNIHSFVEVDVPNGNRSQTLFAGLAKVREIGAEYFAVLDDDDFWFSNHTESLFFAAKQAGREVDVVFSGTIRVDAEARQVERDLWWKRSVHSFGYRAAIESTTHVTREFGSNCFVARTHLLPDGIGASEMDTGEDSLLIGLIVRHNKPVFSYQATALFTQQRGAGSDFTVHPHRQRDLLSLLLRSGFLYSPNWLALSSTGRALEQRSLFHRPHEVDKSGNPVLIDEMLVSPEDSIRETPYFAGRLLYLTSDRVHLRGDSCTEHSVEGKTIRVLPPRQPWAYGVEIDLHDLIEELDQFVVVEFGKGADAAYVGLLNRDGDFTRRIEIPAGENGVEVWLRFASPRESMRLVVQNGERPSERPIEVLRIWSGRQTEQAHSPDERLARARKAAREGYARERAQAANPVLIGGMLVSPEESIKDTPFFVGRLLYLTADRIHLRGDSRAESCAEGKTIRVLPPPQSWAYGVEINLHGLIEELDQFAVIEFGKVIDVAYVGLLDRNGDFVERIEMPAGSDSVEVWLRVESFRESARLVVHNGERPLDRPINILRICSGRQTDRAYSPDQRLAEAEKISREGYALERAPDLECSDVFPLVAISLEKIATYDYWPGASIVRSDPMLISTGTAPWGYSAVLALSGLPDTQASDESRLFWQVEAEVQTGEAAIALIKNDEVMAQRILVHKNGRKFVYFPASGDPASLVIRNGSNSEKSEIFIYAVHLVREYDRTIRSEARAG